MVDERIKIVFESNGCRAEYDRVDCATYFSGKWEGVPRMLGGEPDLEAVKTWAAYNKFVESMTPYDPFDSQEATW